MEGRMPVLRRQGRISPRAAPLGPRYVGVPPPWIGTVDRKRRVVLASVAIAFFPV